MAAKTKGTFDPTEYFALQDIALWSTSFERDIGYDRIFNDKDLIVQTMRSVTPEAFTAQLEGHEGVTDFVRVFVSLGVRSVIQADESSPEVVLHTLEATFAVDYMVIQAPEQEQFANFVEHNCTHNVWPFWRQHVYDTFKRASLPVPVIPLFSGKGSGKKRRKVGRIISRAIPAQESQPADHES